MVISAAGTPAEHEELRGKHEAMAYLLDDPDSVDAVIAAYKEMSLSEKMAMEMVMSEMSLSEEATSVATSMVAETRIRMIVGVMLLLFESSEDNDEEDLA